ncbi:hypothetical protein [Spirosoma sp. KNUC1025]|uniref:hypothetical protein n=1 Tax=Spirosoma sp. KNUC1025 TaxID=2894082 RepID=UPI00386F313A|nr:hypothetical protein LN737_01285 [Spirosoma sp. KNUC1025]
MLYSWSSEDKKITLLKSLLGSIVEGDEKFVPIVKPIISDVHALSQGSKSYYNIDRNNYRLIMSLYTKNKEFFRNINPEELTIDDYQDILDIISNRPNLVNA